MHLLSLIGVRHSNCLILAYHAQLFLKLVRSHGIATFLPPLQRRRITVLDASWIGRWLGTRYPSNGRWEWSVTSFHRAVLQEQLHIYEPLPLIPLRVSVHYLDIPFMLPFLNQLRMLTVINFKTGPIEPRSVHRAELRRVEQVRWTGMDRLQPLSDLVSVCRHHRSDVFHYI